MPQAIPERAPVEDRFDGVIFRTGSVEGIATQPQPDTSLVAQGVFIVRYGVRFLGKSFLSVVPGLVVLDYGDMLTGEDAWNFLQHRSNLHPRAEVAGYRSDGTDDLVFVRQLDLAVPPQVLVYADAAATTPLASPTVLIAAADADIPPRLDEYLPRYPDVNQWKAEVSP